MKKSPELSNRAHNILNNLSCFWDVGLSNSTNPKAVILRHLEEHGQKSLLKFRNCGWMTYCEIIVWLGLPKPELEIKPIYAHYCPHCDKEVKLNSLVRKRVGQKRQCIPQK